MARKGDSVTGLWQAYRHVRLSRLFGRLVATESKTIISLYVQGLLTRVRDNNKHVQEAACSALATLEEAAGRELLESSRITAILKTFAAALQVHLV